MAQIELLQPAPLLKPDGTLANVGWSRQPVLDCNLDGAVIRNADGSLAAGSTPGIVVSGTAATMTLVGGEWRLDRISDGIDGVCV